jgi:hypothetical protein
VAPKRLWHFCITYSGREGFLYVKKLRDELAKPNKAAGFVSSLNFTGAVFDIGRLV